MHKRSTSSRCMFCAALLCLPAIALAHEHDGDLLFFPSASTLHRNNSSTRVEHNSEIELDSFYSTSRDRLRFLAEFMVSRDERDMERMQVGWLTSPYTTLWLGRFHNPMGYWNMEFHHGHYMMTSISRPSLNAFEDDDGVLPIHISGLLVETTSDTALSYAWGVGAGPNLSAAGLTAIDILQPAKERGKLSAIAKLAYHPIADGSDETNIFTAYTLIPTTNLAVSGITQIKQTLAGAAFNRESGKLRLLGELYVVNSQIETASGTSSHTFTSGYMQADYAIKAGWILFGRAEDTANAAGNPYLDFFPAFISSRVLAGTRYAVAHNQALKLELSHAERQDKIRYSQLAVQWSAVFP